MALDVAGGGYFFTPSEGNVSRDGNLSVDGNSNDGKVGLVTMEAFYETPQPDTTETSKFTPGFRYGMLHDLESILWIAIWFLFRTVPEANSIEPALQHAGDSLFG